jgi:hypothetical protein
MSIGRSACQNRAIPEKPPLDHRRFYRLYCKKVFNLIRWPADAAPRLPFSKIGVSSRGVSGHIRAEHCESVCGIFDTACHIHSKVCNGVLAGVVGSVQRGSALCRFRRCVAYADVIAAHSFDLTRHKFFFVRPLLFLLSADIKNIAQFVTPERKNRIRIGYRIGIMCQLSN